MYHLFGEVVGSQHSEGKRKPEKVTYINVSCLLLYTTDVKVYFKEKKKTDTLGLTETELWDQESS